MCEPPLKSKRQKGDKNRLHTADPRFRSDLCIFLLCIVFAEYLLTMFLHGEALLAPRPTPKLT